jgi:hypothetical protein
MGAIFSIAVTVLGGVWGDVEEREMKGDGLNVPQ